MLEEALAMLRVQLERQKAGRSCDDKVLRMVELMLLACIAEALNERRQS